MEPYRPYVDQIVLKIIDKGENFLELGTSIKSQLLGIATVDVQFDKYKSPLMVGLQSTTSSLAKCYEGSLRRISYPSIKGFGSKYKSIYNDLVENSEAKVTDKSSESESSTNNNDALPF